MTVIFLSMRPEHQKSPDYRNDDMVTRLLQLTVFLLLDKEAGLFIQLREALPDSSFISPLNGPRSLITPTDMTRMGPRYLPGGPAGVCHAAVGVRGDPGVQAAIRLPS